MLRRRTALTIGNVVAKNEAQDMTVKELQKKIEEGDSSLLNKLRYHSKVRIGTQNFFLNNRVIIIIILLQDLYIFDQAKIRLFFIKIIGNGRITSILA